MNRAPFAYVQLSGDFVHHRDDTMNGQRQGVTRCGIKYRENQVARDAPSSTTTPPIYLCLRCFP